MRAHAKAPPGTGAGNRPLLDISFLSNTLDPRVTFARASSATYFDASGTLQNANSNTPRIDYGLTSGSAPLGLLIEEQRTNYIRNPRCEGAVSGTPGTMPTFWASNQNAGLTSTVVGSGTERGIPYVDVQLSGTASGGNFNIFPENGNGVAASNNQIWTLSVYVRVVSGSLANINTIVCGFIMFDGSNANLGTLNSPNLLSSIGSALNRVSNGATLSAATVAYLKPVVQINPLAGAINVTLRIGAPQLERAGLYSGVTSPILPPQGSPGVVTRAGDSVTYPVSVLSSTASSLAIETIQNLNSGGNPSYFVAFDDASAEQDNFGIGTSALGSTVGSYSKASGVGQSPGAADTVVALGTILKSALAGTTSGLWTTATNGTIYVQKTNNVMPTRASLVRFSTSGNAYGPSTAGLCQYLRRVRYWPRALTTNQLQQVTT